VISYILVFVFIPLKSMTAVKQHSANWLHDAKWGVFVHYLTNPNTTASEWNNRINNFDVDYLARQLQLVGAKYFFITLGQNSGHYCSPNAAYDRYVGLQPSKCSSRDLVSDLHKALKPLGIKLLVYLPAGAPALDSTAVERLSWSSGPHRNKEFQNKWEAIISEWSLRWGNKVEGWWFDGAYWPGAMYNFSLPPNFQSFSAAARAGNSKSIVAFNPGIKYPIATQSDYEDYTSGELEEPWGVMCEKRWVGKAQLHILSYLGSSWGKGNPRYSNEKIIQITDNINSCGGVITWDVPIQSNGHIPQAFVTQLRTLNQGNEQLTKVKTSKKVQQSRNLALSKKTRMLDSSGRNSLPVNSAKYFAQLGVDGNLNTSAMAGDEWAWTYQVDLGKTFKVSTVKITFGKTFATQYKVLVSRDGIKWFEVANHKNSNGGEHIHMFKSAEVRYVNIKAIKPDGPNQKGVQMSITELEVYR
jgi:F5/8 type C domain/Alpha-L-fucosidase